MNTSEKKKTDNGTGGGGAGMCEVYTSLLKCEVRLNTQG